MEPSILLPRPSAERGCGKGMLDKLTDCAAYGPLAERLLDGWRLLYFAVRTEIATEGGQCGAGVESGQGRFFQLWRRRGSRLRA